MKLLVIGEHKLLLELLQEHLAKYFDEIVIVTDVSLAELKCERLTPNLVLMDVCSKAGNTGFYAAEKLKKRHPKIKVVLMTAFEDTSFIERALEAQVDGFIYKSCSIEELETCVNHVLAGKRCYPAVDNELYITFGTTHEHLTHRELEILRLFCQSKSRKEMADVLGVTASTINFHINNMLVKTGYKKLMSLAMEAASKGYIKIEDQDNE